MSSLPKRDTSIPSARRPFDPVWRDFFVRGLAVPVAAFRDGVKGPEWKVMTPADRAEVLARTAPVDFAPAPLPAPARRLRPAPTARGFVQCRDCGTYVPAPVGSYRVPYCDADLRARAKRAERAAAVALQKAAEREEAYAA